ncbi:hypothetical protein JOD21_002364 [Jeotgalibacillus terrae]|nr:hypothetical protein [Jeotgalibacillus terrae]MBM7579682.1 hypothetical protein [Jeotgalibacillus terrae]
MNKMRISVVVCAVLALILFVQFELDDPRIRHHISGQPAEGQTVTIIQSSEDEYINRSGARQFTPEPKPPDRKYEVGEFQAGMNLLVYGQPDLERAGIYFKQFREIGMNSVTITFPFYQSGWQASEVSADAVMTPSLSSLDSLIKAAQREELSVMLRPTMDEQSLIATGHWRGQIQPGDPAAWFDSYQSLLLEYAELAEANEVSYFNIGTELNSMESYSDKWIELINAIRGRYSGDLIYSFNWDTVESVSSLNFVQHLDHVGIDAYFPLDAPDSADVEELSAAWEQWTVDLSKQLDHPSVIITEAGMIPVAGAHRTPYAWSMPDGVVDRQAQANYYSATFSALKPLSKGIYWWGVALDQEVDVETVDYSPLHGPAEDVIRKLLLKGEPTGWIVVP